MSACLWPTNTRMERKQDTKHYKTKCAAWLNKRKKSMKTNEQKIKKKQVQMQTPPGQSTIPTTDSNI